MTMIWNAVAYNQENHANQSSDSFKVRRMSVDLRNRKTVKETTSVSSVS